jgi:hypothetical protein
MRVEGKPVFVTAVNETKTKGGFMKSAEVEVTPEQDVLLDRRRRPAGRSWCLHCDQYVDFVPLAEVHQWLERQIKRMGVPPSGRSVHFAKDMRGEFMICARSLFETK